MDINYYSFLLCFDPKELPLMPHCRQLSQNVERKRCQPQVASNSCLLCFCFSQLNDMELIHSTCVLQVHRRFMVPALNLKTQ